MRIITHHKSYLDKVETVGFDEEFSRLQYGDDEAFIKHWEGKRIWIIDRNTMADSTVTLVETRITPLWMSTFP